MGRDGEANHVESQLSIPIEKRGQCSLVLRNGAMGARVLVVEILNEPNDLIMDIRQQFNTLGATYSRLFRSKEVQPRTW